MDTTSDLIFLKFWKEDELKNGNAKHDAIKKGLSAIFWVDGGIRTHDIRNHNPTL